MALRLGTSYVRDYARVSTNSSRRAVCLPARPVERTRRGRIEKRKKNGHEVEDDTEIKNWTDGIPLSPVWWAPTFVTLMIVGLLWVVVFYISQGVYPIPKIGQWNIAVGLGTMMVGFLMTLRWR